jgi:hypothetical protein
MRVAVGEHWQLEDTNRDYVKSKKGLFSACRVLRLERADINASMPVFHASHEMTPLIEL